MEIKPQELRIGNIVTIDNQIHWPQLKDFPLSITAIELVSERDFPNSSASIRLISEARQIYSQFSEFIKPIELTPEWLTRLGFQDCNDPEFDNWAAAKMYFKGMIQVGAFRTDQNETVKYTSYFVKHPTFLNGNPINHINTVHQLQNLYFAVSGEELAIDKTSLKN